MLLDNQVDSYLQFHRVDRAVNNSRTREPTPEAAGELALMKRGDATPGTKHFGLSRDTVRKMMAFSVPPGYQRRAPVRRPKLGRFNPIIDQ